MSCPYFWPAERRTDSMAPRDVMLPLVDLWTGTCHAFADQPWQPDESRLRRLCNLGYARGVCDRFPSESPSDTVRFTISNDAGAAVHLYFVIERDHHPVAHGAIE